MEQDSEELFLCFRSEGLYKLGKLVGEVVISVKPGDSMALGDAPQAQGRVHLLHEQVNLVMPKDLLSSRARCDARGHITALPG